MTAQMAMSGLLATGWAITWRIGGIGTATHPTKRLRITFQVDSGIRIEVKGKRVPITEEHATFAWYDVAGGMRQTLRCPMSEYLEHLENRIDHAAPKEVERGKP